MRACDRSIVRSIDADGGSRVRATAAAGALRRHRRLRLPCAPAQVGGDAALQACAGSRPAARQAARQLQPVACDGELRPGRAGTWREAAVAALRAARAGGCGLAGESAQPAQLQHLARPRPQERLAPLLAAPAIDALPARPRRRRRRDHRGAAVAVGRGGAAPILWLPVRRGGRRRLQRALPSRGAAAGRLGRAALGGAAPPDLAAARAVAAREQLRRRPAARHKLLALYPRPRLGQLQRARAVRRSLHGRARHGPRPTPCPRTRPSAPSPPRPSSAWARSRTPPTARACSSSRA